MTPNRSFGKTLHAMLGIYAVLFLLGLETTLGGAVLPHAAQNLGALESFSWLATIQMLTAACATPLTARLGDMWRRKWLVVISVVLLCGSGVLAASAEHMWVLMLSRVLNGLAVGMMAGAAFAVPVDVFVDPAERVKWQSISGIIFAIASSMGPSLGAGLNELWGWRLTLLSVPVVALVVLVVLVFMPDYQDKTMKKQRFDALGALYLTGFIGCSLYGLQSISHDVLATGYLLLAAFFCVQFFRRQKHTAQPILALEVLSNTQVRVISLSTLFSGAVLGVLMAYSPLLLVTIKGVSYAHASMLMLPLLIGMPCGSFCNGYLFRKLKNPHYLFYLGTFLLICGMSVLVAMGLGAPKYLAFLGYGLSGVGLGFLNQSQGLFIQIVTPRAFAGAATGLVSTARSYGGALGSALLGLLLIVFELSQGFVWGLVALWVLTLCLIPLILRIKPYATA